MKYSIFFSLLFFIGSVQSGYAQETDTDKPSFIPPFDFPITFSGNFGEIRANHFHPCTDTHRSDWLSLPHSHHQRAVHQQARTSHLHGSRKSAGFHPCGNAGAGGFSLCPENRKGCRILHSRCLGSPWGAKPAGTSIRSLLLSHQSSGVSSPVG